MNSPARRTPRSVSVDDVVGAASALPIDSRATPLRVLVVDDHAIFADSLVRLLRSQPGLDVVGTAGTVTQAVASALATRPDVVLMDFELPDGNGAAATAQIKALAPTTKVIMLTMRTDADARARAVSAGCSGFVGKEQSVDSLLDTIVAVNRGEITTPVGELELLLRKLEPTHRGLGATLTRRELEVLRLMATGLVNKEIAGRLGVRLNTVRNHVQNILYKLEVHSQLEAVATAVREGLIGPAGR